MILDIWLVRKHELSFRAFDPFRWLLTFWIFHFADETERFRWLMSTPGARPNHRKLLFFQSLDKTKYQIFFELWKHKTSLSMRPIAKISSTKSNRKNGFTLGVNSWNTRLPSSSVSKLYALKCSNNRPSTGLSLTRTIYCFQHESKW